MAHKIPVPGVAPFADKENMQAMMAQVSQPPPDPHDFRDDLPAGFAEALLTALAKDPAQRPESADEYGRLLVAAAG